ncbi:MAG: transglutaminase family protein [Pseudoruegeria sp.]
MMRLTIEHTTRYTYDQPQRRISQSLRLVPASFVGQNVINWSVRCEGGKLGAEFTDGAGDRVQTLTVGGPVDEINIIVSGVVETADTSGILKGHKEAVHPSCYLRDTRLTDPDGAIRVISAAAFDAFPNDPLSLAHELARHTADKVAYTPGSTDSEVTASQALEAGNGVCQDQTHVLMTLARCAGLPARYVTGYLQSTEDGTAHEASHAWAEIYVTGIGWVGFDPANRCCPDARHIRLGSGLDALEAAPVRGISFGGGEETMEYSLSVSQTTSQSQQ